MLIEAIVVLAAALAPEKPPAIAIAPASLFSTTPTPAYQSEARAVDNWRIESALAIEMSPLDAARRMFGSEDRDPARCVKLNNYWCVKRAGWNGEIAADADGHVAFASALEGAAVAALLLRRYYVDYKRHSARAIVERWAPAQCSPMIGRPLPGAPASRDGLARMLPQRIVPMGIAPRGIENTLRARWLAANGRGGIAQSPPHRLALTQSQRQVEAKLISTLARAETFRATLRRNGGLLPARGARTNSSADDLDLATAPAIMEGGGERAQRRMPHPAKKPSKLEDVDPAPHALPLPFRLVVNCSSELARIANYASHVAEGVVAGPDDDLALFTAQGSPTANLAKVMANMAAVEIGPARPRTGLVTAAVAQLRRMLEEPQAADGAPEASRASP